MTEDEKLEKKRAERRKLKFERKRRAKERHKLETKLRIEKEGYAPQDEIKLELLIDKMIENLDKGISGLGEDCWEQNILGKLKYDDGPPRVNPFICPWDKRILEGGFQDSQPSWGCYYKGNCKLYRIKRHKDKDISREILNQVKRHVREGAYKSTFREPNLPHILSKEQIAQL